MGLWVAVPVASVDEERRARVVVGVWVGGWQLCNKVKVKRRLEGGYGRGGKWWTG